MIANSNVFGMRLIILHRPNAQPRSPSAPHLDDAAIGFMAAGILFGGFTQNYRIGAMCVVLGGVLLASSRIIATVPDWAYTVLFFTAGCWYW